MRPAALLVVLLCLPGLAGDKLTNADIVTMVHGKVPQDVITQKIADCEPSFLLDAVNLVALVNVGVPDDVIRAMAAKQRGELVAGSSGESNRPTSRDTVTDSQPRATAGIIRVYVTDSQSWEIRGGWTANRSGGGGYTAGGARPQTAEIIKTLNQRCPGVTVTNRVENAAFAITLDHEGGKALLSRHNKLVVFNRDGDAIFSVSTRALGNSVKDACEAILRNPVQPTLAPPSPTAAPTPAITGGLVDVPFTSNPPGALVSFSGTAACYTPCVVKLETRRFLVAMTLPGYAEWAREFTVEAGKTVAAEMHLAQ